MDVQFIKSSFGGGWLVPRTHFGTAACAGALDEEAAYLYPIGEHGYIVEPYDVEETVLALRDAGCEVTL